MVAVLIISMVRERLVTMPNPSLSTTKQILTLLSIALLVFVFDQLTKIWIVNHFIYGASEAVTSFFNLVRVHNFGAAFSFLNNEGG